jgi:hypothetical protein
MEATMPFESDALRGSVLARDNASLADAPGETVVERYRTLAAVEDLIIQRILRDAVVVDTPDDPEREGWQARVDALAAEIAGMPAQTLDGLCAKAAALRMFLPLDRDLTGLATPDDQPEALIWSVIEDVFRLSGRGGRL